MEHETNWSAPKDAQVQGKYDYQMNDAQRTALRNLVERYGGPFNEADFRPTFDLPREWVAGWVKNAAGENRLYCGCDPDGHISS